MSPVPARRRVLVVNFLAIALTSFVGYARAQPSPGQLAVLDLPVLFVDPATNTASVHLRLINRSSQPITKISLSLGPFKSETSGTDVGARATFAGPADAAAKPTYELASLAPEGILTVKVDIANLWEAGESTAPLCNNGNEIGKLKAVKYLPPFAVKLIGSAPASVPPGNVEIEFQRGQASQILLKNEDAMTYPVGWDLSVGGKTISSDKPVIIAPKSTVPITINPPKEWFSAATGLFKDEVKDATLTLSLRPPLSVSYPLLPQQSLPFKAQLRSVSQTTQSVVALGFVLLALVAGAVCSLLLRDFMPNKLQRIRLEGNLDDIDSNLQDLDRLKDSSLTVPVSVERNRLLKNLKAPWFFSPEIATVFAQCQESIDSLNKRIAVLEELAKLWELLYEKQQTVAPSLILTARDKIREAASLLRRSHPRERNLDEPKTRLAAARQILEGTGPNAELGKKLAERIQGLLTPFSAVEVHKGTYQMFDKQLSRLLEAVDPQFADETKIHPDDYYLLDLRSNLLLLILEYHSFFANVDETLKKKQDQCYEPFLKYLGMQDFEGFRNASIIVNEMQQNIFAGSLKEALQANPPSLKIQLDNGPVHANQPVQLSAWFNQEPGLNKAAAREKIRCVWEFAHGDPTAPGRKGKGGWVVWHYFPDAKTCKVTVSFVDENTKEPIVGVNGVPITVEENIDVLPERSERFGERFKIEATTFVIALAVALLGLVAGAREQLMKLDVTAGFIAVFLLGFSADTIKNLLTQPNREKEKRGEQPAAAARELNPAPTPAKPDAAALAVKSP